MMNKKMFLFYAFIILTGMFMYAKSEIGDYATLGYDTPNGYAFWRVDSSGYFKPGAASTLDIGTSALPVRNIYAGGLIGATLTTGVLTSPTITGPSISGTAAFTGAITNVSSSGIAVSTSATSGQVLRLRGAIATLSTHTVTYGDVWIQTSDNKVYIATRTVVITDNDSSCVGTGCYSAFN